MWWHSFCAPAVVLNCCAVLLDHNNAQVSWKYGTARAGQNFAHTKCKFCIFFAQNICLTIITLLRGPNIIIWSHVLCQVHHPFNCLLLPIDGAAYILKSHHLMLHLQNKAWSKFLFAHYSKTIFFIVIRTSKQCLFYLSNEELGTKLVSHDSKYVTMYTMNVQLCVKLRVGWHPERPA